MISTKLYNAQSVERFNRLTADIQEAQIKIATGKRITRASQDPVAAANISVAKEQQQLVSRYVSNLEKAQVRLNTVDTLLGETQNIVTRIYELALQAKNDSYSANDRAAVVSEMTELREALVGLANARDGNGEAIFAGYKTDREAFQADETDAITYSGDRGIHSIQISENMRINTTLDGASVFMRVQTGSGTKSVFSIIKEVTDALSSGQTANVAVDELIKAVDHVSLQQTRVGAELSKATVQNDVLMKRKVVLEENLSVLEEADMAALITELQTLLTSRDAAQQAFIKSAQQSLFDFLR